MGEGNFILPVKSTLFKKLKKPLGEKVVMHLELDEKEIGLNEDLLTCLQEMPHINEQFMAMPKSHQRYYSHYVNEAKTESTKAKRIARIIESLIRGMSFGEMLKSNFEY